MVYACELRQKGGAWLGAARSWMQSNKINGDRVTWGSDEELRPTMTVRDVEELAAVVAAAVLNDIHFKSNATTNGRRYAVPFSGLLAETLG